VRNALDSTWTKQIQKQDLMVSYWRVSDLSPIQDPAAFEAHAGSTRLGDALADLPDKFQRADLQAIVLLSDGQNTRGRDPAEAAENSPAPVFTIGIGPKDLATTVAIEELAIPEQCFAGESVPLQVLLSRQGNGGTFEMDLTLKIDDQTIAGETLQWPENQDTYEWQDETVFNTPGIQRMTVQIRPNLPEADLPPENVRAVQWNSSADVHVLKDRYQVVILSGQPAWETRFLRHALEEDPRFQVLSLWPGPRDQLIVAQPVESRLKEGDSSPLVRALKETPDAGTLIENLYQVDLLILSQLKSSKYNQNKLLSSSESSRLNEWVSQDGGRLLVLGGQGMFSLESDVFRSISSILPVEIPKGPSYRTTPVFPKLTGFGLRSEALVSWRSVPQSQLPPLESYHELGQPNMGAEVLMETGTGLPLLVWQTSGTGRVMCAGSDSFWRYGLPAQGVAAINAPSLDRFWSEICRFLVFGARGSGVRLFASRTNPAQGELVRIWAHISPALQEAPEEGRISVKMNRLGTEQSEEIYLSRNPDSPTLYEGQLRPQQTGTYRLRLEVLRFADEKSLQVSLPREEYRHTGRNRETLEKIASQSGGAYLELAQINNPGTMIEYEATEEQVVRSVFAGSLPWVLPLLLLILTTEWVLRKRASLP
jgi:hypothetical protein